MPSEALRELGADPSEADMLDPGLDRVDVDLANGALGGTAQLLLRNADGIL